MTRTNLEIAPQRGYDGGMHRHMPGLTELRVTNRKDRAVEIDIAVAQLERFRAS